MPSSSMCRFNIFKKFRRGIAVPQKASQITKGKARTEMLNL